jgi:glutaredoxin
MSSAEIYSKDNCPFCVRAKNLLNLKKIPFTEIKLGVQATKEDIQTRLALLGESVVVSTVPQIFYKDKAGKVHYIGGYDQLTQKQAILGT